jgi:Family of unknown function (DUF6069)
MNATTADPATSSRPSDRALSTKGIAVGALAGGVAGALANVALFFIGAATGESYVAELQPGVSSALPVAQVAIASIVPAVPAMLLAMILNRFTSKPGPIFAIVAVVFGLLSMGGPMSLPGASTTMKIVLALMHVVSAATITAGLLRGGRRV